MRYPILARLFFLFLCCIALVAKADSAPMKSQLQKVLDAAIAESSVPGAVLLVSSPDIGTIVVASGYADKDEETLMTVNNNFRIASMSKTFLAVAILKLAEEGKLNLDDKMSTLLPDTIDFSRIPNGDKVTVRQLLQMRSGIPNYMEYDGYSELVKNKPDLVWAPKDGIEAIYDATPNAKPGSAYEYSNTNYLLLQAILESITEDNLAAVLRKDIFSPLHLNHTYVEMLEERSGGFKGLHTHGYELENKKMTDVTSYNDGLGLGDGGIVSTAEDMKLFVKALLEDKTLLSAESLHEMQKVKDDYGLGIYPEDFDEEKSWTHSGSASGFSGQYYYLPNKKLIIIVLTNLVGSGIYDDVSVKALEIINKTESKAKE